MPKILIVDDEKNIRSTLGRSLRLEGYATVEAEDGEAALGALSSGDVDLVIMDLQMPGMDGMGLLEAMKERGINVPSLVLTAHGSIERAVRAVRLGAFDFIEKPPAAERLLLAAANALRVTRLEEENARLAEQAGVGGSMIGSSAPMQALADTIRRVAPTQAGVLLQGENGTGKELVARAIHAASTRRDRPLVTVNCAAIPETLFESELFGHARGAFTGATEARRGKFQQADGGTLFLDEIGEVPLPLQPKMLRALETGEVERVGGQGLERVNVRVIAATNRDLEEEVRRGRFREDLYYRLLVVPVRVPALRERPGDIPALARALLESACRRNRIRPKRLSDAGVRRLEAHDWPGNVRELRNAMERIAILVGEETVEPEALAFLAPARGAHGQELGARRGGAQESSGYGHAEDAGQGRGAPAWGRSDPAPPGAHQAMSGGGRSAYVGGAGSDPLGGRESAPIAGSMSAPAGAFDLSRELQRHERDLILQVLERSGWHMSRAAQELGVERSHLYKKLKALGIERPAST